MAINFTSGLWLKLFVAAQSKRWQQVLNGQDCMAQVILWQVLYPTTKCDQMILVLYGSTRCCMVVQSVTNWPWPIKTCAADQPQHENIDHQVGQPDVYNGWTKLEHQKQIEENSIQNLLFLISLPGNICSDRPKYFPWLTFNFRLRTGHKSGALLP